MYYPRNFQMLPWFAQQMYFMYPQCFWFNPQMNERYMKYYLDNQQGYTNFNNQNLMDYGPQPFVIDIDEATKRNNTFRTILWTGDNFQVSLMSIPVGGDIGLEVHEDGDQFIRIEDGDGMVLMGDSKDNLDFQRRIEDDDAIMIPNGKWHNIINTGNEPLKLYAIYAPPEHPYGTIHQTKEDAQESERY